ncbi:hypothetical protein, partial [Treponema sp. R6D11]
TLCDKVGKTWGVPDRPTPPNGSCGGLEPKFIRQFIAEALRREECDYIKDAEKMIGRDYYAR